jgi:hypothetical protein
MLDVLIDRLMIINGWIDGLVGSDKQWMHIMNGWMNGWMDSEPCLLHIDGQ